MVVEITTQAEFKAEVLDFNGIVILDTWAEWCGPCRALAPTLHDVAQEFASDEGVKVVKVNVEASQDNGMIAQQLGVMSIPALFYFKNGELVDKSVGMAPKQYFVDKVMQLKNK